VTLTQSWSPARPSFRVGETVTRTITLHADGASESQLPTLAAGDVAGVKQYAAKPATRTVPGGAELVQSFDVLASSAGTITLPRVEVPWWDTASGTQRTAVLAEETIEVRPAAGATAAQTANAPATAMQPNGAAHTTTSSAAGSASAQRGSAESSKASAGANGAQADEVSGVASLATAHRGTLIAAAATLLALLGGAAWTFRRRRSATSDSTAHGATSGIAAGSARVSARALVDDVQRACAANDPRAVRTALLAWGRATWSDAPPVNAAAVARRLGDEALLRAVKSLDDSLYAPQTVAFDGAAFRRAFDGARRAGTRSGDDTTAVLPALYPESRLA
jgi:hypothetical protein